MAECKPEFEDFHLPAQFEVGAGEIAQRDAGEIRFGRQDLLLHGFVFVAEHVNLVPALSRKAFLQNDNECLRFYTCRISFP
jgi:hypothetical protein